MASPATNDEFLDLLRKSGVADEKRVDAYVQRLQSGHSMPREPAKLAGLLVRDGYITQFQAEHILRGKWKRFSIGKYKVLERLGSGGMGAVYLCEHKLMRRRVAVKVLPAAKAKDESALKRFEREARAAAALDHPNIVHAYDIDQDEDLHFLVMEYVDGASLQEIVKKSGVMDPLRAAHYIRQAALGLEHAHTAGLIHRDIKPGNILVDRSGVVKILDMGLARFFHDEDDNLTRKFDENVLGTADYLAPEQAVDSHDVTIRADIYSLGATLYFCLTGKPPFGEGTVAQKLIWHQTKQPKPVQQLRPETPAELVAILERMMAKDPGQRYQRPGEVYDALGTVAAAQIPPPSTSEMPTLSLAVTGGPASNEQPTIISQTPGPASPAPRPATTTAAALRTSPAARETLNAAQHVMTAPPPLPQLSIPSADYDETWATDTENPIALADTDRVSDSARRRQDAKEYADRKKRFAIIVAGVGLVATIALAMTIYYYFQTPRPDPPPRVKVHKVTSDAGIAGPNVFPTIQLALKKAADGDTILLLDKVHQENLIIDKRRSITRFTIRAAQGVQVLWRPKEKDPKSPVLRLVNADGFELHGQGITLDGTISPQSQVEDLVRMSMTCPGMLLEDLQARSFKRSALSITNCAGTEDEPIRIVHLQASVPGKEKPECVIRFAANPEVTQPKVNDYILFDDTCQFLGMPRDKIIKMDDPAVLGKSVTLPPLPPAPPPPRPKAPAKK